ncbi:MAG: ABC transporter permease [[Clostridium] scindens]
MLHLLKYRFIQTVRDYPIMFWALAFPLILGTFFYFSFGSAGLDGTGDYEWDPIKVAIIEEDLSSKNAESFQAFLEKLEPDTLDIQDISSESDAIKALKEETILGIYYVDDTPSLSVGKNGINESILSSLLKNYNQNAAMIQKIAMTHPEKMGAAIEAMKDYHPETRNESLGGKTLDPNVQYFFALIAYACLSGAFLGVRSSLDSQANLSALGARRSITPTHKLKLILIDMTVLFIIHFINILVLNLYLIKVLGISLGDNIGALLVVDFMGSMIGVSLGIAFGCLGKLSTDMKLGLTVAITLIPGFLAGLMFGNMKNIIELHCPIINRLNPAAVLSDAFYCMSVYNDAHRFARSIGILAIMSALFLLIAYLGIRRERYDSI